MRYAEGGNYHIDLLRCVAVCTVRRRPDVSREDGMRFAEEKAQRFEELARESRSVVRAMLLDLREAPTMWGPVTQGCLERMLAAFQHAERRVAVVVSDDALQSLQMKRIVKESATSMGQVFTSFDDADTWVREQAPPPSSRRAP